MGSKEVKFHCDFAQKRPFSYGRKDRFIDKIIEIW